MNGVSSGSTRMTAETRTALWKLAHVNGIQTSYTDVMGRRRRASAEALVLTLRAMGTPLDRPEDASAALRRRLVETWQQVLEPVTVAWDGQVRPIRLRVPAAASATLATRLHLEDGTSRSWSARLDELEVVEHAEVEGSRHVVRTLRLRERLSPGYHRLELELGGQVHETLIISAPGRAYPAEPRRLLGAFIPLYALHSRSSWGAGDFSDLEAFHHWLEEHGVQVVGTLPFFAAFLDHPFDPGPYAPASRLFWNELYVDPRRAPNLSSSPAAAELIERLERDEAHELRSAPLIDYHRVVDMKRAVLRELSRAFFDSGGQDPAYRRFVQGQPLVEDYARFQATCTTRREAWGAWPERLREGDLRPGDYDERERQYHLYAQWLAHEQIQSLAETTRRAGPGLYVDLPLGVHGDAFDVWNNRELFVSGASIGAPPDALFTRGQNWGFPPLHPRRMRELRYGHVVDYLRHVMVLAGILRIDHVMGLHRLFWVPRELETREGVYVRYPAEEPYAILCLESHRNRCWVVGENLGTVPGYVNRAMERHNIQKMHVVQYEAEGETIRGTEEVPEQSIASLNTHDMPPFAGFWRGLDILDRHELGLMDDVKTAQEQERREVLKQRLTRLVRREGWLGAEEPATEQSVMRATLQLLAASPASIVLATLEDAWLEQQPQNVPGTGAERPNWRRRARHDLETLRELPELRELLEALARARAARS